MQRFRDFEDAFGVVIRSGWIRNDISMTIGKKRTLITYSAALAAPIALLAVTTMIEVLDLRWEGRQFRFRYPHPADEPEEGRKVRAVRRDYRKPERLARRRLLPSALLEQAEREEWGPGRLQDACGMDLASIEARVREWQSGRPRVVLLDAFNLDGPIPF